jgi:hypothetical protein
MAFAQTPDFSGTWTPDPEASGAPAGGGGGQRGGGGPMTVKHQGSTLTIERQGRNGTQTTSYKLDGSEQDIQMGQMTAKATAKIEGGKLIIVTKTEQGENTQTWSLAGNVLTIERTGGRGPSKTVYKKGA